MLIFQTRMRSPVRPPVCLPRGDRTSAFFPPLLSQPASAGLSAFAGLKISPCLSPFQRCQDCLPQLSRRLHTELYRYPCTWTLCLIDKVDIERMFQRRIERMVIRYVDLTQCEPAFRPLAFAPDFRLVDNHCTHHRTPFR